VDRADVWEQYGELVAAEPGDRVDLAQDTGQTRPDLTQQLVAVVVARTCR